MKPRVINGINVLKCKFHSVNTFNGKDTCELHRCGTYDSLRCEENPDCYYKQLARKTQECDRYRRALEKIEFEVTEEMKETEADTNAYGCFMEIINIINKAE